MTRKELIEKYRTNILGGYLDAVMEHRKGGELVLWLRTQHMRLETMFGEMLADFQRVLESEKVEPKRGKG